MMLATILHKSISYNREHRAVMTNWSTTMYQVVCNNCMRNTWWEQKSAERGFFLPFSLISFCCSHLLCLHMYLVTYFFLSWWNNFGSMQFQIWKVSTLPWHIYLWWNIWTHFRILQIHFRNGLYLCIFLRLVWAEQYCSKNSITIWSKELLTEGKFISEHRRDKNKELFKMKQYSRKDRKTAR